MSNKLKNYAVRASFKKEGYQSKSFRGIVIANSPKEAESVVVDTMSASLKSSGGLCAEKKDIIVRKVELFNDFLFNVNSK